MLAMNALARALGCAALACLVGAAAQAGPEARRQILSCRLDDGANAVDLWIEGRMVHVFYGPKAGPAVLSAKVPVATIEHHPWEGVGRSIWESTTIHDGPLGYEFWMSVDRLNPDPRPKGGLNVIRNGQTIASHECLPQGIRADFWAMSDAKGALGICWDLETHAWTSCKN